MTINTDLDELLTAEERAEADRKVAELLAHGYRQVDEFKALRAGARIRHRATSTRRRTPMERATWWR
jgi:hypothetical protein